MKLSLKFFTAADNQPDAPKQKFEKSKPTGYISPVGKIIFPSATIEELGLEVEGASFKVGTQEGKRKIKSLYLVPSQEQEDTFSLEKTGRGAALNLGYILKKGGVDYSGSKHTFVVSLFNFSEGVVGYELTLAAEPSKDAEPKKTYTGKPR